MRPAQLPASVSLVIWKIWMTIVLLCKHDILVHVSFLFFFFSFSVH